MWVCWIRKPQFRGFASYDITRASREANTQILENGDLQTVNSAMFAIKCALDFWRRLSHVRLIVLILFLFFDLRRKNTLIVRLTFGDI